jgi:hypothetical protein
MSDRSQRRLDALTRRAFLRTGLSAGALLPVAAVALRAPAAWAEEEKLVTETPAAAPTVQALQYKSVSDKPDQSCSNCQFYTPKAGGLGKCQLFVQGLVEEKGWCMSWTKKIS